MPWRIYNLDLKRKIRTWTGIRTSILQIISLALLPIELSKFPSQSMLKRSSWNDKSQTLSLPWIIYNFDLKRKIRTWTRIRISILQIISLALLPIELSKFPFQSMLKRSSSLNSFLLLWSWKFTCFVLLYIYHQLLFLTVSSHPMILSYLFFEAAKRRTFSNTNAWQYICFIFQHPTLEIALFHHLFLLFHPWTL